MNDDDARRALDDAERICAVPAPTFEEAARAALVAELLSDAGAPATIDAVGNVVARAGAGAPDGPPVVFAAHLDTVFAAGTPIAFTRTPDRLAAPGIGDNSVGVAGLVHLARHLRSRTLRRPIALVASVGEEGLGDLRGAKALLDTTPCAAFVAVEGTMQDVLVTAAVGSLRDRVTVRGPGGHAWGDRGAPSAVDGLLGALDRALQAAARYAAPDVSFNIGVLRGGTTINTIAAEASADLDLRAADDDVLAAAGAAIQRAITDAPSAGLAITIERLGHRPGGATDASHPLIALARRARERAGLPPAREEASSTDANAAHGRGIPAITVGISTGGNVHRPDEYLDLPPVAAGLRALAALADELDAASAAF